MSGATAKGKKQANKNAYRRAKKKQQRSVSSTHASLRIS
jgi:splicing factor 3B subunit 2